MGDSTEIVPALLRFERRADRFDTSTWCNRLDALLTFSNAPFKYPDERGDVRAAPRGKLPCLRIPSNSGEGEIIPDSLFAYEKLISRGQAKDLDEGLEAKEVALSRAIQALIEELYWIMTRERWYDQFYAARDKYALARLPYPVRLGIGYYLYRDLCTRFLAHGIGANRPLTEIDRLRDTGFDALASFVKGQKYALGKNKPTRADAVIFGFVVAALTAPGWAPNCTASLRARLDIIAYVEALRVEFYPQRPSFA